MQNEFNSLMAQYQTLSANNTMLTQPGKGSTAVSEKGEFIKVKNFDEVKDYPTRLDGTATLFFDFENKVFWSKKFINGGHAIQAFKFDPINNAETPKEEPANEIDYTDLFENVSDATEERFTKIESMLADLLNKKEHKPKIQNSRKEPKDTAKEIVKDEI